MVTIGKVKLGAYAIDQPLNLWWARTLSPGRNSKEGEIPKLYYRVSIIWTFILQIREGYSLIPKKKLITSIKLAHIQSGANGEGNHGQIRIV